MEKKKLGRAVKMLIVGALLVCFFLATAATIAHASGLVDETISDSNLYSKYSLDNWQLDFYVDSSWGWLPWNWKDSVGKSVMYGLYMVTNFLWTVSLYASNGTGYIVQEAYKLDIISDLSNTIGSNIQTIAGVSPSGFSSDGILTRSLMLIIFVIGIYVTYTGLVKHETSKAISALVNFCVIFIMTVGLVAYAPDYISNVNSFSTEFSTGALDIGTKMVFPDSEISDSDSVDMIRDSLFSIQVEKPWLLLQYGSSSKEEIGADRVEELLTVSPNDNKGEDREAVVKTEINDRDNMNMTLTSVGKRLGMAFVLLFCNLGISFFVLMLCAFMIFAQILFIIYALFFVMSLIISMIPGQQGVLKKAVLKLFNTIMTRAGLTLVVTVAFSLSSMIYSLSANYPFLVICFLQIVVYAGIYVKMNEIMGMMSLGNDGQDVSRRMFRRPYMFMRRNGRRMQRKLTRAITGSKRGGREKGDRNYSDTEDTRASSLGSNASTGRQGFKSNQLNGSQKIKNINKNMADRERYFNTVTEHESEINDSYGRKIGNQIGKMADTPKRISDGVAQGVDNVKNAPTNIRYGIRKIGKNAVANVKGVGEGVTSTLYNSKSERSAVRLNRQQTAMERQQELKRAADLRKLNVNERPSVKDNKVGDRNVNDKKNEIKSPGMNGTSQTAQKRERRIGTRLQNKDRLQDRINKERSTEKGHVARTSPSVRQIEHVSSVPQRQTVVNHGMEKMIQAAKERPVILNGKEIDLKTGKEVLKKAGNAVVKASGKEQTKKIVDTSIETVSKVRDKK